MSLPHFVISVYPRLWLMNRQRLRVELCIICSLVSCCCGGSDSVRGSNCNYYITFDFKAGHIIYYEKNMLARNALLAVDDGC